MKKILLIEDSDDVRNNAAELLTLSGYEVILAENGKIGIQSALTYKPDLIICDIMMPVLDGYGVLHALQKNEQTKAIPFIFLTARAARDDFRKGMALGADDYITKPFDGTELLHAVEGRLKKTDFFQRSVNPEGDTLVRDPEGSLLSITQSREVSRFKKKQIIYWEGNRPNRFFYILKGRVKTYKIHPDGKVLITEILQAGDFFGYVPMMEGSLYSDTAESMEDTDLAVIPKADFDLLLNGNIHLANSFIKLLVENIAHREGQLLGFAYNSLREKVAGALITVQAKFAGDKKDERIKIERENLATMAGTAKESLSRTLSDFCREHLIEIKDGNIIIVDQKKLRSMCS